MRIGRRLFLKSCAALGAAGAASALPVKAADGAEPMTARDGFGVLVDTTQCLGCRACEVACAEANGNPEPERVRGTASKSWLREENLRLNHFLEARLGMAAADGGTLTAPPSSLLRDDAWREATRSFLRAA